MYMESTWLYYVCLWVPYQQRFLRVFQINEHPFPYSSYSIWFTMHGSTYFVIWYWYLYILIILNIRFLPSDTGSRVRVYRTSCESREDLSEVNGRTGGWTVANTLKASQCILINIAINTVCIKNVPLLYMKYLVNQYIYIVVWYITWKTHVWK